MNYRRPRRLSLSYSSALRISFSLVASTPTYIKSPGILVVTVAVNGRLIHYQNNRAGAQSVPLRKCLHEKTSQELNSWSGQTPWKRI
ncbi:hypothetical protein FOFC_02104 [Fusarium oxysporum]|nr:hypothetical protein FOFC_02104 [Fusarium oxysporum]